MRGGSDRLGDAQRRAGEGGVAARHDLLPPTNVADEGTHAQAPSNRQAWIIFAAFLFLALVP